MKRCLILVTIVEKTFRSRNSLCSHAPKNHCGLLYFTPFFYIYNKCYNQLSPSFLHKKALSCPNYLSDNQTMEVICYVVGFLLTKVVSISKRHSNLCVMINNKNKKNNFPNTKVKVPSDLGFLPQLKKEEKIPHTGDKASLDRCG